MEELLIYVVLIICVLVMTCIWCCLRECRTSLDIERLRAGILIVSLAYGACLFGCWLGDDKQRRE